MKKTRRVILFALCAFLGVCLSVFAMSSTRQVAFEGRSIHKDSVKDYKWPAGVLDLLNDPLRANGWNHWFSELPNDVNHYELKLRGQDDVEHIILKFAKIRCDTLQIQLSPSKEPIGLGFTTRRLKENNVAAVLAIGSQKIMDQWFQRLTEIEPGVRKFGVHRYTEVPKALPPTLTLYVGNSAIDLTKLQVPIKIKVLAAPPDARRKKHEDDTLMIVPEGEPLVRSIYKFVAEHESKQEAARKHKKVTK